MLLFLRRRLRKEKVRNRLVIFQGGKKTTVLKPKHGLYCKKEVKGRKTMPTVNSELISFST